MSKDETKALLPRPLQGGFFSPRTWLRGAKNVTGSFALPISGAIVSGLTGAAATVGTWVYRSENAYSEGYAKGESRGIADGEANDYYDLYRKTKYDNKTMQPPCRGTETTGRQHVNWGAFGFAGASVTTVSTAYTLAFAAGYAKNTAEKMMYLCGALALVGLQISWISIAHWVMSDVEELGECHGYNNGYVEHCNTTEGEGAPVKDETICINTTARGMPVPADTIGGDINPSKASFFGKAGIMVPVAATAALAVIIAGYRTGRLARQKKEAKPRVVADVEVYQGPSSSYGISDGGS